MSSVLLNRVFGRRAYSFATIPRKVEVDQKNPPSIIPFTMIIASALVGGFIIGWKSKSEQIYHKEEEKVKKRLT
jgi:hypothetical protein